MNMKGDLHLENKKTLRRIAALKLTDMTATAFTPYLPQQYCGLLELSSFSLSITPDGKGIEHRSLGKDQAAINYIYPMSKDTVENSLDFCDCLNQSLKRARFLLLANDRALPGNLLDFAARLKVAGHNTTNRDDWRNVPGVLYTYNFDDCFALGDDLPLPFLVDGLNEIAITDPTSELARAQVELNAIINLDDLSTGFIVVVDAASLELVLLEGGPLEVKAYYESLVPTSRKIVPVEVKELHRFSLAAVEL